MKIVSQEDIQQHIGITVEPTPWFKVKQEQINQFADCTLDHQFIHVDPERAKDTPFGSTIAHGFLSLSMLSHFAEHFSVMIEGIYMGINYGFDKVRFIAPVKVNSQIRCHAKLLEVTVKKPGQLMFKTQVTVEIEGSEKPALQAEWLTMQMVK